MSFRKEIIAILILVGILSVVFVLKGDVLNKGQTSISDNRAQGVTKSLVRINDNLLKVDMVDTPEMRERGLSGRAGLSADEGMFFVFEEAGTYHFWMKDMNFPIDIIWIGDDFRIVDISKSVSEHSFPRTFSPSAPARYVLEVNAGFSVENGVHPGDLVELTL